jgi:uncharacterized protein YutE (UPF0331/DUF86 family)
MNLDSKMVQSRLDIIERNIQFLKEYMDIDEDQFLGSYKDIQAVKHSLFEAIESCIDIAAHIIAVRGLQRPESYSDTFRILKNAKIVGKDLGEKLEKMTRFRNILVHNYEEIDNSRVIQYVKQNLDDITDYVACIVKLL